MKPENRVRLRRGAYLLPSLFTIGNVLVGFYAVVRGLRGDFEAAGLLIGAAAILDTLDGRVARLTRTESDFGREFDSLADVLTFGAAPALLTHVWGLSELGRVGWLVPLFYLVCCATRLARYNVQTHQGERRYFVGLPTPAAACTIGALLFYAPEHDWKPWGVGLLLASLLTLGGLMVSTFRYPSLGSLDLRRRWSYRSAIVFAAIVLLLAYRPAVALLAVAVTYTAFAPLAWLVGRVRRRKAVASGSESQPDRP